MQLDINMDAVVVLTDKLERMHRSALPVSVRGALNDVAFEMKKSTLPKAIQTKRIIQRKKTFFKKFSKVEMAKGWNVKNMYSAVGFKGRNQAVRNLEEQEFGGTIPYRKKIPMPTSRTGKSIRKNVRSNFRLSTIKKARLIDARKLSGKSNAERYHKAVYKAGEKNFIIATHRNKTTLWRINKIRRTPLQQHKLTPIYKVQESDKVRVKAIGFMQLAQKHSSKKIPDYYIKRAKKKINELA